jgi:hypothetical protein
MIFLLTAPIFYCKVYATDCELNSAISILNVIYLFCLQVCVAPIKKKTGGLKAPNTLFLNAHIDIIHNVLLVRTK